MRRILITGAAGNIGRCLREGLRGRYPAIRLSDVVPLEPARDGEELAPADLTDMAALAAAMEGVDCVVHLGAVSVEDAWEKILPANIAGTWNVFEAARRNGVRRIVYASSHHAIGFYRRARSVDRSVPPRPDGAYGVSKVFGEAVGRLYADKHGMTVACLRIGAFQPKPRDRRLLKVWLSPHDAVQLVTRCIEAPDYHFLVVYGVSNNTRCQYLNTGIEFLGYRPEDNAEDYAAEIERAPDSEDPLARQFHGGMYVPIDFDGDTAKID
jgi:uronate dehydrogenase